MPETEEPTFPLRLTQAQRRCVAERLVRLKPRLMLDCGNQRTLRFALEEIEVIANTCRTDIPNAPNGMDRNSLRHVADAAEQALETFGGGSICRIPVSKRLYQLKITLNNIKPPIWRRIQVKDCSLDRLHQHIQTAMGWTNSHLHQFRVDETLYGDPDLLCDCWDESCPASSLDTRISEIVPQNGGAFQFEYEYDFGDGWKHEILFEGCWTAEKGGRYPVCVDGERACPPEDVGGTSGYEEYLEVMADPEHEEHDSLLRWRGRSNPEAFDACVTTRRMRRGLPDWRTQR